MTATEETSKTILSVERLTKSFGDCLALECITFSITDQEIVGLIGPNGAGKTTLLECIAGLLPVDSGSLNLTSDNRQQARPFFYLPESLSPYPEQWVCDVLSFIATAQGSQENKLQELIAELELTPALSKRVGALSKGFKRRLLLAIALLSASSFLILDEPFDGLDLRQTIQVMSLLRKERDAGRTLLLSIHQLSDAEEICDRFLLLSGGKLIGDGTMRNLQDRTGKQTLKEVFLALT